MSLPTDRNVLVNYLNPYYVETGIWRADSLAIAMDAGFRKIIGIDIDQSAIEFAKLRFDLQHFPLPGLQLIHADSAECLWDAIKDINQPITFFLDSHYSLLEGEEPGQNPFPLMSELQQISRHPIKTHTIIIDDFLYMTHPDVTGWTKDEIFYGLHCINVNYKISLIANPVIKNLLIATP